MAAGPPTVEHKEVVLGLVGVSAGLSGLLLVFLGLVVSTYQSFAGDTPQRVLDRYRNAAALVLAAFTIGIGALVLGMVWLFGLGRSQGLYAAFAVMLFVQIVALVVTTVWTVLQLAWRR